MRLAGESSSHALALRLGRGASYPAARRIGLCATGLIAKVAGACSVPTLAGADPGDIDKGRSGLPASVGQATLRQLRASPQSAGANSASWNGFPEFLLRLRFVG